MRSIQIRFRLMFALVLGAGGTVGMASHAGVLRALQEAGVEPDAADVVIGTSAGAIIGSLVRSGRTVDDLWAMSQGEDNDLWDVDPQARRDMMFTQGWRTPLGLARRAVGSAWVVQRSVVRWPPAPVPVSIARFYRGGLVSPSGTRQRLAELLGDEWPDADLRLCTVDLVSGKRVVLGGDRATKMPLSEAARASSAVPGLFEPVRAGRRVLVDGGAHSCTNADVAAECGADLVIVAAPMAMIGGPGTSIANRITRAGFTRRLHREVAALRAGGAQVLVIAPGVEELAAHGLRMLRPDDVELVARASYEATRRILELSDAEAVLTAAQAATAGDRSQESSLSS
jgi:NTE family protein